MKISSRKSIIVGAGLFGISTVMGVVSPTLAAPRHERRDKQERRDIKEARKEVKQERKDVRRADSPRERREELREYKEARKDLRRERQDVRRSNNTPSWDNRYNRNGNNGYNRNGNYDRDRFGNRGGIGQISYNGVVEHVFSGNQFQIRRTDGNTLRVATNSGVTNSVRVGDRVTVRGNFTADQGLFIANTVSRNNTFRR